MKVLLDTNVILDYLLKRSPFYEAAKSVFDLCLYSIDGFVSPHSLIDIFYMLSERTNASSEYCRSTILKLRTVLNVISETDSVICAAAEDVSFFDFEDSVQHICAVSAGVAYIITRNQKDFAGSKVPVVSPTDFLSVYR